MTQGRRLIFVYVPSKHQAVIVSTFILTRIYGRDDLNLTISMADQSYYRTPKKEREEFYAKRNLRLKRMESSDLEAVDDLCRDVHFDIGYHNLKLYYEMSPDTWDIVLDENGQVSPYLWTWPHWMCVLMIQAYYTCVVKRISRLAFQKPRPFLITFHA